MSSRKHFPFSISEKVPEKNNAMVSFVSESVMENCAASSFDAESNCMTYGVAE